MDSPVTLVIKAPNQKYDDQKINCHPNWTVEKLKAHLSDVYPSKPVRIQHNFIDSFRLQTTEGSKLEGKIREFTFSYPDDKRNKNGRNCGYYCYYYNYYNC